MTAEPFDMTDTIIPKSDQINADDLMSGPRTVTISGVRRGSVEQPIDVDLVEFPGRAFRPSKTVRRIMVSIWGPDAATYVGKRMVIYRDPDVKFGGMTTGGIRVSAMSHLAKRTTIALTTTRGKRAPHTVEPLADAPPPPSDGITREQTARMTELFNDAGIERSARIAYCCDVIGRDITKPSDLSSDEAAQIIGALDAMLGPDGTDTPTLGDGTE